MTTSSVPESTPESPSTSGYLPVQKRPAVGLSIASLIIGIVAFLSGWVPFWGIIAGSTAVALGIIALRKRQSKGLAITGLALGGVAAFTSIITTLVMIVGVSLGPVSSSSTNPRPDTSQSISEPSAVPSKSAPAPTVMAEPSKAPKPVTEPKKPALTTAQSNAVRSAQSYLDYTGFSRSGLIEQLEFESFSTDDATFAVDYLAPDWNAEAAESAKSYLDFTSFSRQGLIDQLIYDGFSQAEAEYGVNANGY